MPPTNTNTVFDLLKSMPQGSLFLPPAGNTNSGITPAGFQGLFGPKVPATPSVNPAVAPVGSTGVSTGIKTNNNSQSYVNPNAGIQSGLQDTGTQNGTQSSSVGGGYLKGLAAELSSLTPQERQLFGIGQTPQQQQLYGQMSDYLTKLGALQEQLAKANAPSSAIQALDTEIAHTQNMLGNLNVNQYLKDNPNLQNVGITQGQAERTVGQQRLPIEQSLSNLLYQKSLLGQQRQFDINALTAQSNALQGGFNIAKEQYGILPPQGLPPSIGGNVLEKLAVPQITPHFETLGGTRYQINTNQFGQEVGRQAVGPAPTNAFNFFQNNPGAGQGLIGAVQSGNLNPSDVNSRNMGFLSALYAQNPNFNQIQAKSAANFWASTGTQEKLAWSGAVDKDLNTLQGLSDKVARTSLPLLNKAILAGETKIEGDENATAFAQAASRTAAALSRVLGDSGGSDFRTRLAAEVLDPSFSAATFTKVMNTERTLINNLKSAFAEQGGQTGQGTQSNNDPLGIR